MAPAGESSWAPHMNRDYPKVLVLSESPFSMANGFGVTLNTFFSGWPRAALRQFYTRSNVRPETDLCSDFAHADVPGHWGRRYGLAWFLGLRAAWRGRFSARWMRRQLGDWRPDLIYALIFSGETLAFAAWLGQTLRCPWIVHVADDGIERFRAGVENSTR